MKEIIKLKKLKGITAHKTTLVNWKLICYVKHSAQFKQDTTRSREQRVYTYTPFKPAMINQKPQLDTKEQHAHKQRFRPRFHLSEAELKYIKDNNLCYKCRGKYTRTHSRMSKHGVANH